MLTFALTNLFRDHLTSDLRPYSCISESCSEYDQLFETREKWMQHQLDHSEEWQCDAPHAQDSCFRVFSSEKEFTTHLLQDHIDSFTEPQLPFLIARGKRPSLFPFTACPFCETPELDLRNIKNLYSMTGNKFDHLEKSEQLQKHIGIHLQNFSLLAFLEPDENNDATEIDTDKGSKQQQSGSNLSDITLDFDHGLFDAESVEHQDQELTFDNELGEDIEWSFVRRLATMDQPEIDRVLVRFKQRQWNSSPDGLFPDWAAFWNLDKTFLETLDKLEVKRQCEIHEFIQQEAQYVEDLNTIFDVFKTQLVEASSTSSPIISSDIEEAFLRDVFGNIKPILYWHTDTLLIPLRERQAHQGPIIRTWGDIVIVWVRGCRSIYTDYVAGYPISDSLVREQISTNSSFSSWLETVYPLSRWLINDSDLPLIPDVESLALWISLHSHSEEFNEFPYFCKR